MARFRTLALALVAACGLVSTATAASDNISGVYRGTIATGTDTPGMTVFTVSTLGEISGNYVFEDANGSASGELRDCYFEVRMLRCVWHDAYGAGDFVVLFSPDYRSFDGSWFEDRQDITRLPDSGYRWMGKRTN